LRLHIENVCCFVLKTVEKPGDLMHNNIIIKNKMIERLV